MRKDLLSRKVAALEPSGIRKFFDIVTEMENAISLGVGEPDFDTPWRIREEGIYALEKGRTFYTSNAGLKELREAVCNYYDRRFNIRYSSVDECLITVGGSEGIDALFRAIINDGDEILVCEPCFVSYKPTIIMAGGVPVSIALKEENNFKLVPSDLEGKINENTKAIMISFPSNPTGAIMRKAELEEIAKIAIGHDLLVISDEIYAELTYGGKHISIAELDGMKERTVIINGFSKAYAMTGWRLGYALGPKDIIALMTKVHQFGIMSAPTISQYAAVEAANNCDKEVEAMREAYDMRRHFMVQSFRDMGLDCFEPEGAFYIFPSIKKTGLSSEEFATKLLYEKEVAVVPGSAFGKSGEGFIRCSYAYSMEELKVAIDRIREFVASHISR